MTELAEGNIMRFAIISTLFLVLVGCADELRPLPFQEIETSTQGLRVMRRNPLDQSLRIPPACPVPVTTIPIADILCRPWDNMVTVSAAPGRSTVDVQPGDTHVPVMEVYQIACQDIHEFGVGFYLSSLTETSSSGMFVGEPRFVDFQLVENGEVRFSGELVPYPQAPEWYAHLFLGDRAEDSNLRRFVQAKTVIHYTVEMSVSSSMVDQEEIFGLYLDSWALGGVSADGSWAWSRIIGDNWPAIRLSP